MLKSKIKTTPNTRGGLQVFVKGFEAGSITLHPDIFRRSSTQM